MFSSHHKIFFSIVIIIGLLFFPLYVTRAFSGWLIVLKEYALDLLARLIARTLQSIVSNAIVNTVLHSGRDGGPAFVTDWREFLQTSQHRGEDIFRAQLADAISGSNPTICPQLRTTLANSLQAKSPISNFNYTKYRTEAVQYFKERNRCTLPTNFDLTTFENNFTQGGGWDSWGKLIQPQNNIYGVYADSFKELNTQRGFEEGLDTSEAESGSGYTSKRTGCEGGGSGEGRPRCVIWGQVVTPGDLFGQSGAATLDAELRFVGVSDEIAEVVVSVVGIVIDRLADFASGSLLDENGPPIGSDSASIPPGAVGSAQQDCVNACIVTQCPASQPTCTDVDGDGIVDNTDGCATSQEASDRQNCIGSCQSQGCQ